MTTRIDGSWRRFEESATGFASKLRNDIFLKTQVTLMFAFVVVTVLNISSLIFIAAYVSEETLTTILNRWGSTLLEGVPSPSFNILNLRAELEGIWKYYFLAISTVQFSVMIVLIFIVSKVILEPIREAINAQRNFIGYTAHELRTPLAVARASIEATLLGGSRNQKDDYETELRSTMIELDGLSGIIDNLVILNALSNFKAGEYHHYDIHEILGDVIAAHRDLSDSKHIDLSVASAPGLLVWGNKNGLKQLFGNLVSNALNYTPDGKTVSIRAEQLSSRYVRVTITDTGIGIPEEDLPLIFKPFFRTATAQRQKGGSGLGLAIVRELVRLHRGSINIESELNKGTVVTVDLPTFRHRLSAPRKPGVASGSHISFSYLR